MKPVVKPEAYVVEVDAPCALLIASYEGDPVFVILNELDEEAWEDEGTIPGCLEPSLIKRVRYVSEKNSVEELMSDGNWRSRFVTCGLTTALEKLWRKSKSLAS